MVIPERVTRRGRIVPAFQIDEKFAEEISRWKWRMVGQGYLAGRVNGDSIYLHRYIWLLHTGSLPQQDIDHINRDKLDNRVENLRDVSRSENNRNQTPLWQLGRKMRKKSELPIGVRRDPACRSRPYKAAVRDNGKIKHLGMFATPEEASAAYLAEVQRLRACCPSGT